MPGKAKAAQEAKRVLQWDEKTATFRANIFDNGYHLLKLPLELMSSTRSVTRLKTWLRDMHIASGEPGYEGPRCAAIFQGNPHPGLKTDGGDLLRLSAVTTPDYLILARDPANVGSSYQRHLDRCKKWALEVAEYAYPGQLIHRETDDSLLYSLSGNTAQVLHCDNRPSSHESLAHSENVSSTTTQSLSALIALEDGAHIWVVPSSQIEARKMAADRNYFPPPMEAVRVDIPKDHVLFFCQDLIHAGGAYLLYENVRFHMYIDHINDVRESDTTGYLNIEFGIARAKLFTLPK